MFVRFLTVTALTLTLIGCSSEDSAPIAKKKEAPKKPAPKAPEQPKACSELSALDAKKAEFAMTVSDETESRLDELIDILNGITVDATDIYTSVPYEKNDAKEAKLILVWRETSQQVFDKGVDPLSAVLYWTVATYDSRFKATGIDVADLNSAALSDSKSQLGEKLIGTSSSGQHSAKRLRLIFVKNSFDASFAALQGSLSNGEAELLAIKIALLESLDASSYVRTDGGTKYLKENGVKVKHTSLAFARDDASKAARATFLNNALKVHTVDRTDCAAVKSLVDSL